MSWFSLGGSSQGEKNPGEDQGFWGTLKKSSEAVLSTVKADLAEFTTTVAADTTVAVKTTAQIASETIKEGRENDEGGVSVEKVQQTVGRLGQNLVQGLGNLRSTIATAGDSNPGNSLDNVEKLTWYQNKLQELQNDPETYTKYYSDMDEYRAFEEWKEQNGMETRKRGKDVPGAMKDNKKIMEYMQTLNVPYNDFWNHYFYRKHLLDIENEKRAEIAERLKSNAEEEIGWDDDDDDDDVPDSVQNLALEDADDVVVEVSAEQVKESIQKQLDQEAQASASEEVSAIVHPSEETTAVNQCPSEEVNGHDGQQTEVQPPAQHEAAAQPNNSGPPSSDSIPDASSGEWNVANVVPDKGYFPADSQENSKEAPADEASVSDRPATAPAEVPIKVQEEPNEEDDDWAAWE